MNRYKPYWILGLLVVVALTTGIAYTVLAESDVPAISGLLPDPFLMTSGRRGASRQDWEKRREEMRDVLLDVQYGHAPPIPEVTLLQEERTEVFLEESGVHAVLVKAQLNLGGLILNVGYWMPKEAESPLPTILINEPIWWEDPFVVNNVAGRILKEGYMLAGFFTGDLASFEERLKCAAQEAYSDYDWGVVAVSAWGYSVTMNWLEALPVVNKEQVAIWGHSRGGKACFLAGALDERFAAVMPHMSGMGGAAAYRVRGEGAQRIEQLLEQYWLLPEFFTYQDKEDTLPFDQHYLHALVAPRPLYMHVGKEDHWGNPRGEQAAWEAAKEVYAWLGKPDNIGIYFGDYGHHGPNWREGEDSWITALQFLNWQFKGVQPEKPFDEPMYEDAPKFFDWRKPE